MKKLIAIILILSMLLPAAALAEDQDPIIGKWSFYWDTRPMNEKYNNGKPMMDFLIHSMDLYFLENNIAYMTMAKMDKSESFKQEWPAMDGVWLMTESGKYVANFKGTKYKIEFDDNDRLMFYMTEKVPYPFTRIPIFDYFAENP